MPFEELIKFRSDALRAIRLFFYSQDFVELDAPALVATPGQEPYLEPFKTMLRDHVGKESDAFLITSPEYACKKALAQGIKRVFSLQHVYRNLESLGGLHQPEFMMLEWYRANASFREIMDDVEQLVAAILAVVGRGFIPRRVVRGRGPARTASRSEAGGQAPTLRWVRLSVKAAFARYANIDEQTLLNPETTERYEDWFFRIFLNKIEPRLQEPTILYDYPAPLSALARLKPDNPRYAERFEVYWKGIELANAFSELTDPVEQRRRFLDEQEVRRSQSRPVYPLDEDFLAALARMPPSGGIALGVDRLLMLLLGCKDIEEVVPFAASKVFKLIS